MLFMHLQRAAALDENQVSVLGRMALMIRERAYEPAGRGTAPTPAGADEPDVFTAPLAGGAWHLRRLGAAVDRELSARVRNRPLGADTLEIARMVFGCKPRTHPACRDMLAWALRWYALAVDDNPNVPARRRAILLVQAARLAAMNKDPEAAARYMNRALQYHSGLEFHLARLTLFVALGDTARAEAALNELDTAAPAGPGVRQLEHLREWVREMVSGAASAGGKRQIVTNKGKRTPGVDGVV